MELIKEEDLNLQDEHNKYLIDEIKATLDLYYEKSLIRFYAASSFSDFIFKSQEK